MQRFIGVSLAASVGTFAFGGAGLHTAKAADMEVPQGQYQGQYQEQFQGQYQPPPPDYRGPPPAVYGYPPPPPAAYAVPPVVVLPGPYYGRWPYWRGYYGPRFAYGYGRWGYGWRRW
jgi:hypothetical protein